MSLTYFLTLMIYIWILIIVAATWFLLHRVIKNLRSISNDLQANIDKLEEWKHRWIY